VNHNRFIVVADWPDGHSEVLYNGPDVTQSAKAMQTVISVGEAEVVLEFSHPVANRTRYPLHERLMIEAQTKASENRAEAEQNAAKIKAQIKREQAAKLLAEADLLHPAEAIAAIPAETESEQAETAEDSAKAKGKGKGKGK
jgi:hypothetical protein